MRLSVLHNSFEDVAVRLKGSSYVQEVAFEELPSETDGDGEALAFGDVVVGEPKTISFTVRNFSSVARRFA